MNLAQGLISEGNNSETNFTIRHQDRLVDEKVLLVENYFGSVDFFFDSDSGTLHLLWNRRIQINIKRWDSVLYPFS